MNKETQSIGTQIQVKDKLAKFFNIWFIIVTLCFIASLILSLYFVASSSQANNNLEVTQNKLENVIKNQRSETNLNPQETTLNRSDFLDIVERELEYSNAFAHMITVEFYKALFIAFAALLLATIGFMAPFYKK
jgi:hypothetical protein